MKEYELVVLLHPDLEIDADAPISKVEKLITNQGGTIVKRDNWGKKRLAYKIKKQQFAVYVYFEFKIDPSKVRALEDTVLITEEVMRHLIVSHVEYSTPVTKDERGDSRDGARENRAAAAVTEGK